jgi:uroporphyrinogen-III decarboxylase
MVSRERLINALQGKPIDRIPVYTQIPFALTAEGFKPGAFHGYDDYDNWRERDPAYWNLVRRMQAECDNFFVWRPPCMHSDHFFVPRGMTTTLPTEDRDGKLVTVKVLRTAGRELRTASMVQPGTGHTWVLEHFCKKPDDAEFLLDLPWDGYPAEMGDFFQVREWLGDHGVVWVTVPSPILIVCRLFDPTEFLILIRTEKALIHRLLETASDRIRINLGILLKSGAGPIVRFGGAEHATPPIMSPDDFDALVVQYDTPLMRLVKQYGGLVAVHCHGRIRHALTRFVEMGVDQTDPVEALPDGDLTLAEARRIHAGKITLTGNLQMRELAAARPSEIRLRVRQIVEEAGPDHLILTTTGTPLEPISAPIEANYHAFIDAALEYGKL